MLIIDGSMSRKELAQKYKISDKTLNRKLKLHKLDVGYSRILLPRQIKAIVAALGPWETHYQEPP